MSILLALVSMACAACTDLVYRHRAARADALQLVLVGAIWTALAVLGGGHLSVQAPGMRWALVGGVCGCVSHAVLQAALRHGGISVCATIYRMHVVPACLLGVWVLGEHLTVPVVIALGSCIVAILLVCGKADPANPLAVAGAITAAVMRSGMTVAIAAGLHAGVSPQDILAATGLAWLVGALVLALVNTCSASWHRPRHQASPPATAGAPTVRPDGWWRRLGWGSLAGVLVAGNVIALAHALAGASLTAILPIAQCSLPLTALLAWLLLAEPLSPRRWASIACACFSIMLLSLR